MPTSDAKVNSFSSGEEDFSLGFSEWLKRRRQELDLTQEQLATRASCSVFAIRKMESGERRPSRQLAELLAKALEIPAENQPTFIQVARGERSGECLYAIIPGRASPPAGEPRPTAGNLPRSLTPFIGREPELAALGQLLCDPQCSLLTIVGPGGIGKTRLAIEAANQYKDHFPDGVWFVPLAALNSPALLVPAIADAVHFRFQDPTDPQTQLLRYLCAKNTLIILDNAEHLLDSVGLFTEILNACPQVKLLVTSRERINLLSEWVFEVQGLPVPASDQEEQFASYSAVVLFVQSARRVQAGFEPRDNERRWVLNICQTMEGMPLGIELSAAWVGLLSCEEIAKEIKHNIDFLSVSMRDLPERHRSIRAVFDHSWNRLTPDQQQVMCQLSVFQGGFQRQAAEQVAGTSLSILSTLVNRTLLRRVAPGRYDLHELVRQYSAGHLAADPQAQAAAQQRHYAYFLALVETANEELKGSNQLEWLERLEQDYSNLRVALEWSLKSDRAAPGDERSLQLAGALRWFWYLHGHFHEGRDWLMQALQSAPEHRIGDLRLRARALEGVALLVNALGDHSTARQMAEESMDLFRALSDQHGLADALLLIGQAMLWQGETVEGRARLVKALEIYREAGDQLGIARTLSRLGSFLADWNGDASGRAMLEESVAILEEWGDKYFIASTLVSLGIVSSCSGEFASARANFERALITARETGHVWGIADALTNLGCLARTQGHYAAGRTYLEEALLIYQEQGFSIWRADPLCALAEIDIVQGDLTSARLRLQEASAFTAASENKWLETLVSYFLGLLAYYEGDIQRAVLLLETTTTLAREGQYKSDLARSLIALGRAIRSRGDANQAVMCMREGLDLCHRLGQKLGIAISLEGLAGWASEQHAWQAAKLFGMAEAIRETIGAPLPPIDCPYYESDVARARAQLGEAVFACAWAEGKAMALEQAIDFALNK